MLVTELAKVGQIVGPFSVRPITLGMRAGPLVGPVFIENVFKRLGSFKVGVFQQEAVYFGDVEAMVRDIFHQDLFPMDHHGSLLLILGIVSEIAQFQRFL